MLFSDKNKSELLKNITTKQDDIWAKFFRVKSYINHNKRFTFNHMIHTDGVSVTVCMIDSKTKQINALTKCDH